MAYILHETTRYEFLSHIHQRTCLCADLAFAYFTPLTLARQCVFCRSRLRSNELVRQTAIAFRTNTIWGPSGMSCAIKKLAKLYWPSWKRSAKRLIVLVEPKSGGTPPIKIFLRFAPDRCPPLSNSFRRHWIYDLGRFCISQWLRNRLAGFPVFHSTTPARRFRSVGNWKTV